MNALPKAGPIAVRGFVVWANVTGRLGMVSFPNTVQYCNVRLLQTGT